MRWHRPLILLCAFALRMIRLQARSLWYDEAFAILYGSSSPARMVYGTVAPVAEAGAADVHPLLYYSLLHGWMRAAGQSPFAARFLSVIFGVVTVALLWRLASSWFGTRMGVAVGLLAAVHPFHVAYSQEARMYALLALGSTMAALALLQILVTGSRENAPGRTVSRLPVWWLAYIVGATLILYRWDPLESTCRHASLSIL